MTWFLLIIYLSCSFHAVYSSAGDSSPYFQRCTEKCISSNCSADGLHYLNEFQNQPIHLQLLQWDCDSECKYECMWKTTEAFQKRNWKTPQFYGKWPFIRIFGIQEPASVLFSLLNMYAHYSMFQKFKKSVRSDSPFYWLWHAHTAVSINTWIWSTIFHTRDLPFTEFMDYTCAFSYIVMSCYCMIRRILMNIPRFLNIIISIFFIAFFINHAIYLRFSKFDYSYNMKLNIILGSFCVVFWFLWSLYNSKDKPYMWKCAAFYSLSALSSILELFDFPPIFWIFDSHSLWHLSTAIICPILYSFIIDDCRYLKEQMTSKLKFI